MGEAKVFKAAADVEDNGKLSEGNMEEPIRQLFNGDWTGIPSAATTSSSEMNSCTIGGDDESISSSSNGQHDVCNACNTGPNEAIVDQNKRSTPDEKQGRKHGATSRNTSIRLRNAARTDRTMCSNLLGKSANGMMTSVVLLAAAPFTNGSPTPFAKLQGDVMSTTPTLPFNHWLWAGPVVGIAAVVAAGVGIYFFVNRGHLHNFQYLHEDDEIPKKKNPVFENKKIVQELPPKAIEKVMVPKAQEKMMPKAQEKVMMPKAGEKIAPKLVKEAAVAVAKGMKKQVGAGVKKNVN